MKWVKDKLAFGYWLAFKFAKREISRTEVFFKTAALNKFIITHLKLRPLFRNVAGPGLQLYRKWDSIAGDPCKFCENVSEKLFDIAHASGCLC